MPVVDVPALPVLAPATVAAVATALWWSHRRGRLTASRAALTTVVCVYAAGVLGHVLFPFTIDLHDPTPWRVWVHLTPLVDAAQDPIGLVLNAALFVPLGFLLPLVTRVDSLHRAALVGFLTSLGIETVQLLGDLTVSPGRVADVDDLVANTAGTAIGFAAWLLLVSFPPVRRALARAIGPGPIGPVRSARRFLPDAGAGDLR